MNLLDDNANDLINVLNIGEKVSQMQKAFESTKLFKLIEEYKDSEEISGYELHLIETMKSGLMQYFEKLAVRDSK